MPRDDLEAVCRVADAQHLDLHVACDALEGGCEAQHLASIFL